MPQHSSSPFLHALVAGTFLVNALGPLAPAPVYAQAAQPQTVTIPGTLQSELGCSGDWQPSCDKTFLVYDEEDDVWQGTFEVSPANDQDGRGPRYKAAINQSWGENYGLKAQSNGSDIPLVVTEARLVKFYYDRKNNWVTDNFNTVIATAIGDFQTALGCNTAGDPGCLRSWLQDPNGTGLLTFVTNRIPAGDYDLRIAINESLDEVYGAGGRDGAPIPFTVKNDGDEIYFAFDPNTKEIKVSTEGAPRGNLATAQAYWVTRDTIVWNTVGSPKYTYFLHSAADADLQLSPAGVVGGNAISLTLSFNAAGAGEAVLRKFPHLTGFSAFKLNPADLARVPDLLKGRVAVSAFNEAGRIVDATSLQIPGVLDDVYAAANDKPLGVVLQNGVPSLHVWAPTAQNVNLLLFADARTAPAETLPMTFDPATGIWSITGTAAWLGRFYLYEVTVYVPSTSKVEVNRVTDPYAISLATNSTHSQIVDLNDPALKPDGWDSVPKPALAAPEDIVLYELHVRDFSIHDASVPEDLRGTFMAFTLKNSDGMKHLATLAQAGVSHVHLLPAFDIATVNEDRATRTEVPFAELAQLPPDSEQQQALVEANRSNDGFNWGYDPFHYNAPEGSYSTDPDGPARIREFRAMVQALNQTGLRVVMDVVYNHTTASGQSDRSVLDRVVPGYYHRLNGAGQVEKSTCCDNTATEHLMMQKLMRDSIVLWATAYKVDGFRFDLMGHHMLANMQEVRAALDALTPAKDGVDGAAVYVYGEGWNFGEVADNRRGRNATQLNIGGTGIGVFNDRLRDGVRGGGPFDNPMEQGFATGLSLDPSDYEMVQGSLDSQREQLLKYASWIRIGLAGNLRNYAFDYTTLLGNRVTGADIDYNGSPAGYTLDPGENIVYAAAHDNETLFDIIQLKSPVTATLADRVRMNNLAVSIVALSQGVPFFHAGDEILRSKSLDRNSYDSGDWFNKLDFTYQDNNFGAGLPPQGDNGNNWAIMQPLLANPALKPGNAEILQAFNHFQEFVQIRRSSPLFRLRTAEDVQTRVKFLNTGAGEIPGLIVMVLDDTTGPDLDPNADRLVVIFNADKQALTFADASFKGGTYQLHALLANSADPVVRTASFDSAGAFTVPGRTAAVFVLPQGAAGQPSLTATQAAPEPTATAAPTSAPTRAPEPTATPVIAPPPAASGFDILLPVLVVMGVVGALSVLWAVRRKIQL